MGVEAIKKLVECQVGGVVGRRKRSLDRRCSNVPRLFERKATRFPPRMGKQSNIRLWEFWRRVGPHAGFAQLNVLVCLAHST